MEEPINAHSHGDAPSVPVDVPRGAHCFFYLSCRVVCQVMREGVYVLERIARRVYFENAFALST